MKKKCLLQLQELKCLEKFLMKVELENVGLLLRGIEKEQIKRGMVIAKPGSITLMLNLKQKFTSLKKKRAVDILHFTTITDLNFILER